MNNLEYSIWVSLVLWDHLDTNYNEVTRGLNIFRLKFFFNEFNYIVEKLLRRGKYLTINSHILFI